MPLASISENVLRTAMWCSFSFSGWSQAGSDTRGGWQIWRHNSSYEALIVWLVKNTIFASTTRLLACLHIRDRPLEKFWGRGGGDFQAVWIFKANALILLGVLTWCAWFFVLFNFPLRAYVFVLRPLLKLSNGQSIIGLLAFIGSVHSYILKNGPFAAKPSHGVQKHLAWTQTTLETLKEFLRYGTLLVFLPHVFLHLCLIFF